MLIKIFLTIIFIFSTLIYIDINKIKVVDGLNDLYYNVNNMELNVLDKPKQENIQPLMINLNGVELLLKYKYYGKFKLIRKENYYIDENSDIVPFDFVLGWDKMSILDNINLINNLL